MSSHVRLVLSLILATGLVACSPAHLSVSKSRQKSWVKAQADPVDDALTKLVTELERNPDSQESHHLLAVLIAHSRKHLAKTQSADRVRLSAHVKLVFDASEPGSYAQDYFDDLTPASDYKVEKIHHHTRPGAGLPMIGSRDNKKRDVVEEHYAPEGIMRPVTAVAEVRKGRGAQREVRVRLLSPLYHETVRVNGRTQALAADLSAPWAGLLTGTGKLRRTGLTALLSSNPKRDSQLYLMEPYDPRKRPLIMVHGFLSTPLGWAGITNDLWADPYVRQHYQIWHYHYPTSAPFLYSAMVFRRQLDEVCQLIRQQGYPPVKPITILAHSMGGLMTKTLITDSGEAIWNTVMKVPVGKLQASPEDQEEIYDILHWKARNDIPRVIYSSVPHWGSRLSKDWIGRAGSKLIKLPPAFIDLVARIDRDNPEALREDFKVAMEDGSLTSIGTLSPDHPLLPILNGLPIKPWVTLHSIIGNRGSDKPLEKTGDGVIMYVSAHWDGVASEVVVPSWHGSFKHPLAIEEVKRILKLD